LASGRWLLAVGHWLLAISFLLIKLYENPGLLFRVFFLFEFVGEAVFGVCNDTKILNCGSIVTEIN
jgi:hypothetical protein